MQRPQGLLRVDTVTESAGLSLAMDHANMEGRQKLLSVNAVSTLQLALMISSELDETVEPGEVTFLCFDIVTQEAHEHKNLSREGRQPSRLTRASRLTFPEALQQLGTRNCFSVSVSLIIRRGISGFPGSQVFESSEQNKDTKGHWRLK